MNFRHSHDVYRANLPHRVHQSIGFKKQTAVFLAALLCAGALTATFFYNRARAATTYTWNQTGTASWATDTNWTPTRTTPAADDILIFANGATTTVTNVPTQTIGQLSVSANTTVNLQNAALIRLTIAGGAGSDLDVQAGSALNLNSNIQFMMVVGAGATGSISGSMTFSAVLNPGFHRLEAVDPSGITFNSGATFTAGTNFSGSAFGTTNLNSVIFANGSTYVHMAGNDPFGAGQPNSVVIFQTGSLFSLRANLTPAFSGRTYANFEMDSALSSVTVTGGSAVSIDNLTMTAGTLNFNMTGTPGHSIKGNVSVASGATLNFNPAAVGTVNFNGVGGQSISNSGTLTTAANQTFVVTSATTVTVNNAFTLAGTMNVNSGGTLATGATYTNNGTTTVNGTFRLHSGGVAAGNAFTYGAGSTLHYFGTGTSQTSTNVEWPAATGPTNVTINNSSGVTLHAARTIAGTLDLLNGIFATGGQLTMFTGSQITKSAGDMTGMPQGAGTYNVVYSGFAKPSGSELDGAGLTNVTLDMNPSQFLSLGATKTVPGVLTLMNGLILTGGNTLIIGATGSVARTNGHVVGNFQKTFNAAGTRTFEVGTFFDYSPVDVNATAGTFPANFTVSATIGAMPGISGPNKLGRFWTLTNTTVGSANLTFNYLPGDVTGTVANYQFVRKTGGTLTVLPPSGTPTSTQAIINGVTTFSDWTLAEPSSVTTVLVVNNNGDSSDITPGDGVCATGTAVCTLRAAIEEANALTGVGTIDINFSGVVSPINLGTALPNLNHNVNINGPGAALLTVQRSAVPEFRIFAVNSSQTVAISGLTISNGNLTNACGSGGGIFNQGDLTLTNTTVSGNHACLGNGISNAGILRINSSTLSNNTGGNGGAIENASGGSVTIDKSTLKDNIADLIAPTGGGAILARSGGSVTITNSTISGNKVNAPIGENAFGGFIDNAGILNVTNSTISGNEANGEIAFAGAIDNASVGDVTLTNTTITLNKANGSGGIALGGGTYNSRGNFKLRNTIIAGNTATSAGNDVNGSGPNGPYTSQGHNLIGDGSNGFGFGAAGDQVGTFANPINPQLGPLQSNGGPTFTHALAYTSPAVDTGDDCVFTNTCVPSLGAPVLTDQRGFSRQANGSNLVGGSAVDIGALERQAPTATNGRISGQITDDAGAPVAGVVIRMAGTQDRLTVTDGEGNYRFDEVETAGFYTLTPARVNYLFSPAERSFSQTGQHTEAVFTASATGGDLNPLDTPEYFVRQQYLDFLGREPDEAGLNFWVHHITACADTDTDCLAAKRTDTSAAFFISIEFQQTGYLIYRMYSVAYSRLPGTPVPIGFAEFRPDTAAIARGVIVNQSGWEATLEANKQAFALAFVRRQRFALAYPGTLPPAEFVDRLFLNAGVTPETAERAAAIAEFGGAADTANGPARARTLRRVAEQATLREQEYTRAFVLMQYFGYLGRDPNAAPDSDFSGYNFWLSKLDGFNGDFRAAEMVKAFLVAGEYRARFPR